MFRGLLTKGRGMSLLESEAGGGRMYFMKRDIFMYAVMNLVNKPVHYLYP